MCKGMMVELPHLGTFPTLDFFDRTLPQQDQSALSTSAFVNHFFTYVRKKEGMSY